MNTPCNAFSIRRWSESTRFPRDEVWRSVSALRIKVERKVCASEGKTAAEERTLVGGSGADITRSKSCSTNVRFCDGSARRLALGNGAHRIMVFSCTSVKNSLDRR